MDGHCKPYLGFSQPSIGFSGAANISGMGRTTKKDRPPSLSRAVLSWNIANLRDEVFSDMRSKTARNKKLAEESGTTLSQIQRIIDQQVGTSVDQLDSLAKALKCSPADLMSPYFQRKAAVQQEKQPSEGRPRSQEVPPAHLQRDQRP